MFPLELIGEKEIVERHSHAAIECLHPVPPPNRQKQHFAGSKLKIDDMCVAKFRELLVIRVVYIYLTVNRKMIVNEVDFV